MLSILTAPKPSLLICSWNHCILVSILTTALGYLCQGHQWIPCCPTKQAFSVLIFTAFSPDVHPFQSTAFLLVSQDALFSRWISYLTTYSFSFCPSFLTCCFSSDPLTLEWFRGWSWDLFYLYSFPWWLNPGSWLHMSFICWWFPNVCLQHETPSELSF